MSERVARAIFDELYAAVSALLVEGRYRPGDRIGLKELATQLHVSVTPLREIMSRAASCESWKTLVRLTCRTRCQSSSRVSSAALR